MRNQKGMSYITLIIVIIVLAFVVAIAIHFTKVMIENRSFETYETDMLKIQGKVKILQQEAIMDDDEGKLQGRKLNKFEEVEEIKKLFEKEVISSEEENYDKYYIIDRIDIENMKLENIKIENGFFIVNYNSEEVIYTEGVQKGDKVYYKLSDIRKAREEENKDEKEENSEEKVEENNNEETEETSEEESEENSEETEDVEE